MKAKEESTYVRLARETIENYIKHGKIIREMDEIHNETNTIKFILNYVMEKSKGVEKKKYIWLQKIRTKFNINDDKEGEYLSYDHVNKEITVEKK